MNKPELQTERLLLRQLARTDAARIADLAGHELVFDTTENIPHPYEMDAAVEFIQRDKEVAAKGEVAGFAVELKSEGLLIGGAGLRLNQRNRRGSLGYWLGVPYWGKGYMTEVVIELIRHGFEELELNRIDAQFLKRNPASGRVMAKAGMRLEAEFENFALKRGVFEDVSQYVIYAREFQALRPI